MKLFFYIESYHLFIIFILMYHNVIAKIYNFYVLIMLFVGTILDSENTR